MNDYRKQIKQHQDAIESLNEQLAPLREIAKLAVLQYHNNRTSRPAYPHAEEGAVAQAEAELDHHKKEAARLERLADWEEGVNGASATMGRTREKVAAAQSELSALQAQRQSIKETLSTLLAEQQNALGIAVEAEQTAAREYAKARVGGTVAAEKKAQGDLQTASAALALIRAGDSATEAVADAVKAEILVIDQAIDAAAEQLDAMRSELLKATRYLWADRLEKATYELAALAAHVNAAERELGWRYGSVDDLNLPLLSPGGGNRFIDKRYVLEISEGISFDVLTAA